MIPFFSPMGRDGWSEAEVREGFQTVRHGTPHPSLRDTFSPWEKENAILDAWGGICGIVEGFCGE